MASQKQLDGLTGQITTLSPQNRAIFEQRKAGILADLDPKTVMERELADAIAWDTWRLSHLRAIEMNLYALGQHEEDGQEEDPDEFDTAASDTRIFRSESKRFELMSLYEQRMNRNIHRNLTTLRDLQAERKRNYERDKQEEIRIARLHEFNSMQIHASTLPSKNGFIFSNEEIAQAAVRQRYLETASWVAKNASPRHLYGNLSIGVGDSYFEKVIDPNRPPPEALAMDRLDHPEEFDVG